MKYLLFATCLFILTSCSKETTDTNNDNNLQPINIEGQTGILIHNEGQFMLGNAELSFYSEIENKTYHSVYESINSQPLGDVLNSVYETEDFLYLVVNNSGKIIKTDKNLVKQSEITGFTSPRRMISIDSEKALVTDLFSNSIYIVDLNEDDIAGTIVTGGWTEHLFVWDNKTYVADLTNQKILIINNTTLTVEDEVSTPFSMTGLVQNQNDLYVLTQDESNNNYVTVLNMTTGIYGDSSGIGSGQDYNTYPVYLVNSSEDDLIFLTLNGAIISINVSQDFAIENIYDLGEYFVYGLDLDESNNRLIISDAKDFSQEGEIHLIDLDGNYLQSIPSGVSPNGITLF